MWPFKDVKMLQRELAEHRMYREAQVDVVHGLETRLNDTRNALATVTIKRDIFAMRVEAQQREIDRLKATLAGAAVRDPKTGRYGRATNV